VAVSGRSGRYCWVRSDTDVEFPIWACDIESNDCVILGQLIGIQLLTKVHLFSFMEKPTAAAPSMKPIIWHSMW
jgi:hypothetical protein